MINLEFEEYFKKSADTINNALSERLTTWNTETKNTVPTFEKFAQIFTEACDGGKRIRGFLVLLGYEIAGRKTCKNILSAAVAYEIFQTAILAHDDIIDQSPTRRGRPTLHTALGADQTATSYAICLGDVGFFLAYQILNELDCEAEFKNAALKIFSDTVLNTAIGEILDIKLSTEKDKKEEDTLTMLDLKTAWYTIIGPLQLGAIIGGADEKLLAEIQQFGKNLGTAFQIQDDLLGTFGDENTIGKSSTSDIKEGKSTLLITHALLHSNDEDKQFLVNNYGLKSISEVDIQQIRDIFTRAGSREYAQTRLDEFSTSAISFIPKLSEDSKLNKIISNLVQYITKRHN